MPDAGSGPLAAAPSDSLMRVTHAERDQAIELLQQAFADGRLTSLEMEERVAGALAARSRGDLTSLTADLGGAEPEKVVELKGTGGRITRTGAWRVPRALRIESDYGGVVLDLSHAVIEHPVIDIELSLEYGSALLTVPSDADVDVDSVECQWGRVVCRAPKRRQPGGPRIRITGRLGYGRLKVRFR
ncbi:DUF1707 domain-containing protein [Spongiactinospora sp. 9N601]|uniref:DUF1707 domain-containing protein n=1 Tax=Spongiactinospora sp. 9N601 TaxID=3375149 RepID=UPI00379D1479